MERVVGFCPIARAPILKLSARFADYNQLWQGAWAAGRFDRRISRRIVCKRPRWRRSLYAACALDWRSERWFERPAGQRTFSSHCGAKYRRLAVSTFVRLCVRDFDLAARLAI